MQWKFVKCLFINSLCQVESNSLQAKFGAYSVRKLADSSRKEDSGPTLNFSSLQSWPRVLTNAPGGRLVNLLDEPAIREEKRSPANMPSLFKSFPLSPDTWTLITKQRDSVVITITSCISVSFCAPLQWCTVTCGVCCVNVTYEGTPGTWHDMVTRVDLTLTSDHLNKRETRRKSGSQDKEQETRNSYTFSQYSRPGPLYYD